MAELIPENQHASEPASSRQLLMNAVVRNILQSYGLQIADLTQAHHVVLDVIAERARQDAQWGGPEHDDTHGLEDFCDLINQRTAGLARGFESAEEARRRMIQIAALAVAAVESMDRKAIARAIA